MMKYREYTPIALFLLLGLLSLFIIRPFLLPLFLGALFAYVFNRPYTYLRKKIKNNTISALLICLAVLIVLIVPGFFLVKTLVQESFLLFVSVKQHLAVGLFKSCTNSFCEAVKSIGQYQALNSQVQEALRTVTNLIIRKGSDLLVSLPRVLLNIFVIFFTMFYFLKDGPAFIRWAHDLLSMQQSKYTYVVSRLKDIIHGIVNGYIIVALIQGALGALGFFLFGVSSPLFWGGVMAFLALIPYIGTGVVWLPAALILFLNGIFQDSNFLIAKGIGLFLYGFIFISSSDNLLRPKLMGHKAKIHPAVVLFGILGGIFTFGILGVIIGPLILSLTTVIIEGYLLKS